jgi:hypothetical protein
MKVCPLCDTAYPNHQTNCNTDGAILIESLELEPGTVIRNKYRIVRVLGQGGMGTVYLADHIFLDRQRALKFISGQLSRDPRFLKRFRMEAQAAIELRHPNVAEVVDLDQAEDGSPYIAMEYVEGPDLRHELMAGPFRVERALAIAHGVALGLGMAHAKGIVHRDVKPENILIAGVHGPAETPKLLDFGIAAMKDSSTGLSRTRGMMLTPEYAAPEQWKGMPSEQLDGRVDIYALGGVLYEMLTGHTNFHSHNTEGWMYHHLQGERVAPSRVRPELAQWPGLDALVLRMLARDREQRPANAAALVEELDAVWRRDVREIGRRTEIFRQPGRSATVVETGRDMGRTATRIEVPAAPVVEAQPLFQGMASDAESSSENRGFRWVVVALVLAAALGGGGFWLWRQLNPPVSQTDGGSAQGGTGTEAITPLPQYGGKSEQKPVSPEPQMASLTVTCDLACNWKLNGRPQGRIDAGSTARASSLAGTRAVVEAEALDQKLPVEEKTLTVRPGERLTASFDFSTPLQAQRQADADAARRKSQQVAEAVQRADALHKSGDDAGAVRAYNEALRLDPGNAGATNGKAEVLKECRILGVSCE